MAPRLSAHLTIMANAAQRAAKQLLRDFSEVEQLQVSIKGPSDFVSQADLRAEAMIKQDLNKARPGYAFLMEESGASGSDNWTWRWVVDPLDGTTNFLHGMPHWAISIGLERRLPDGAIELAAGVIYAPATDEMFWAEKGAGAFMNDRRLRVSARRELSAGGFRDRHSLRGGAAPAALRLRPHARHADAAGRRHPPLRRGRARPRLGRRRPLRRLLGDRRQAVGHRRRHPAGARGRRLCDRSRRAATGSAPTSSRPIRICIRSCWRRSRTASPPQRSSGGPFIRLYRAATAPRAASSARVRNPVASTVAINPSSAASESQSPGMARSPVEWISCVQTAGVKPPKTAVARL